MEPLSPPPADQQEIRDDPTLQRLIPTKNMPALLSYYFGVFGFIPFALPLTVAAIILGIIGLKRVKANPTPGAKGHAVTGIVLAAIQIIIFIAFIVLVVTTASSD